MSGTKIRIRHRLSGVTKLAEELGVTRHHLSLVLHGRRRGGAELMAELERRGIKCHEMLPWRRRC